MTTRYRALITDFGGVVSTSFHGALRGFCVREGLAPDALEQVFSLDDGARGMLTDLERGAIDQARFVDYLAPMLGVSPDRLLERILADLDLETVVADAIERLRSNGIRVAVLSNSWVRVPTTRTDHTTSIPGSMLLCCRMRSVCVNPIRPSSG